MNWVVISDLLDRNSITSLVSVAFVGRFLGRVFTYGMYLYVGRSLGPDVLGAFTAGLIVLQFGGAISQVGTRATVQKYIPIHREADDESRLTGVVLFSLLASVGVGTVLALVLYSTRGVLAPYVGREILTAAGVLLFGIPLWAFHNVGESATLAFKRTKYAVYIRDFARSGSAVLFVLIASVVSPTLIGLSVAYLGALVVACLVTVVILVRLGAFAEFRSPSLDLGAVARYSASVLPQSISGPVTRWGDILVLTLFVTTTQIGWYQSAYQTAILLLFAAVSINSVFPPLASDLYSRGESEMLETLSSIATKWASVLTLFATIYVVVFRQEVLGLFGASYVTAEYVLVVLALGRAVKAMTGPVGFLLSMTEYERFELWNGIGGAVLNIALNLALVPAYGLMGAAVATSVTLGLVNVVRLLEVRRYLGFWTYSFDQLSSVVPLAVAAGAMLMVQQTVPGPAVVSLVVGGLVSFPVFAALLFFISVDDEDRLLLRSVEDI